MKNDLDDISKPKQLCNVRPDLVKIGQLHRLYS